MRQPHETAMALAIIYVVSCNNKTLTVNVWTSAYDYNGLEDQI